MATELPIIQKTYDLIHWFIPILNQLPRAHRFQLGDRMISSLYDLLECLIIVRFESQKLKQLKQLNGKLDVLRYQTRLLKDFNLLSLKRYERACQLLNNIGMDLGGWIKHQQKIGDETLR